MDQVDIFGFFSLVIIVATKSFATEKKKVKCLLLCTIASVKMNCVGQRKYGERLHINKAVKELFRYFFSTSAEGKSIVKK